ncbi:MAG: PA0069 family radical SAM protein [Pseudoxanthomonas sp.]|nr:PA0069 family radical SAM protein [Pseudoxanthomonas sp.]
MTAPTTRGFRPGPARGRGAPDNREGRHATAHTALEDDGWGPPAPVEGEPAGDAPDGQVATVVQAETARSLVQRNESGDAGPAATVNPYRGCEHGCIYCYARPNHSRLDLSPGLDFETRLFAKTNAAELLRAELRRPGYRPVPVMLGAATDGWQPIERSHRLSRAVLEVFAQCRHPVQIVTKAALVERDLDLLAPMAEQGLVAVTVSITTLDTDLARRMEPRASAPARRLRTIETLAAAGIPVGVNVAPVVPVLTDHELEAILAAAAQAGAGHAGWVLLRLPWEVAPLFRDWLALHYPLKAGHVMARMQDLRGGRDYDSRFGTRMRGEGPLADLLAQRFAHACRRLGLASGGPALDASRFRPPPDDRQPDLFAT